MANIFKNKIILVTGGVGSIGSEIVNQLLKYNPKQIRVFDNRETELFHLQQSLLQYDNLRVLVGDIKDKERLNTAMENVNIVFHCAALKHVPLCEYNPFEAVKTNVYGTQNVIETALANNVDRVVNISTDKVTNTINTMGSTKLLAERLVAAAQYYKGDKKTLFSSVRFGNVIGSRGAVIDLFKRQIERGESVTITHPEMTRFIMTIPQAVGHVLKTAEMMQGGEIFILKMPSFILGDLVDIIIEEYSKKYIGIKTVKTIGLRVGEKMYEELMTKEEATNALETPTLFIVLSEINIPHLEKIKHIYKNSKKNTTTEYSSNDNTISKEQLRAFLLEKKLL
jgi:FlaA1/EpsC-like NDP-sugar epimerase